jgi:uncharacterized protein (DUF58 family)
VTRLLAPKLGAYAGLAGFFLLGALAAGRPELAVVALPFAVLPALALTVARDPGVRVTTALERGRVLQDDEIDVVVTVVTAARVERLDVALALPAGLDVLEGSNPISLRMRAGGREHVHMRVRAARWGAYRVGDVVARASDPLRHVFHEAVGGEASALRVYPRPEQLRELVRPLETQVTTGNQVAREKGEGIEFADLRPFVPGDRIRRVNWRASARRSELWVNDHHSERNADVVLVLDALAEAGPLRGGTLDLSVRAASGIADAYLRHKDRVGLVTFGGGLNWLVPGTGLAQLYRIVDAMLDTRTALTYAWHDTDVLPRRTLPPKALVLAVTPLLDERVGTALLDLRARGFDLAVVEVTPEPFVEAGRGEERRLAHRAWLLEREAVRGSFQRVGVPVAVWDGTRAPVAAAIGEVTAFRRFARRASA